MQDTFSQIKTLRDEMDLRRKSEIHEIEERKNVHVSELMKNHEKAFTEIKCYYNDITHNNLDLIRTLKVGKLYSADLLHVTCSLIP